MSLTKHTLAALLICVTTALGCRGTARCATDERFDENGACVPVSSCPSGRDPATGVCTGGSDGGSEDSGTVDSGTVDSGSPLDGGPDAGSCGEDCGSRYCNASLGLCADCLDNSHCPAGMPRCDTDGAGSPGTCSGCVEHNDCQLHAGTPSCDVISGQCLICTADTESLCMPGGFTCQNGSCNGVRFQSILVCDRCMSDGACDWTYPLPNVVADCVQLDVGQPERVCSVNAASFATATGGAPNTCPNGFTAATRSNAAGVSGTYCLPRAGTSCLAIRDYLSMKACTDGLADCGVPGQPDGACHPTGMSCTLTCGQPEDCPNPNGETCGTGGYCE